MMYGTAKACKPKCPSSRGGGRGRHRRTSGPKRQRPRQRNTQAGPEIWCEQQKLFPGISETQVPTLMRRGARYSRAEGCAEAAPRRRNTQATPRISQPTGRTRRRREKRCRLSDISCQELTAYLRARLVPLSILLSFSCADQTRQACVAPQRKGAIHRFWQNQSCCQVTRQTEHAILNNRFIKHDGVRLCGGFAVRAHRAGGILQELL